jgi:hypothetical protein
MSSTNLSRQHPRFNAPSSRKVQQARAGDTDPARTVRARPMRHRPLTSLLRGAAWGRAVGRQHRGAATLDAGESREVPAVFRASYGLPNTVREMWVRYEYYALEKFPEKAE